jgi:hypothetical protein
MERTGKRGEGKERERKGREGGREERRGEGSIPQIKIYDYSTD